MLDVVTGAVARIDTESKGEEQGHLILVGIGKPRSPWGEES